MTKIDYCYHTHTKRCGHAIGEDEEYVIKAIDLGLKVLGFSDHAFLTGISQPHSRGDFELFEDYLKSINSLKDKYKDKIDIKVGFEAEYSDRFIDYYKGLLDSKKLDYLILGQHFDFDNTDRPTYIRQLHDDREALDKYVKQVEAAINSGLFKYIAHPDIFACMYKTWNKDCEEAARKICEMASKARIPLEVNCQLKIAYERHPDAIIYPFDEFWKIASEYDVDVVIGYDSHRPIDFDYDISFAYSIVKKYNLRLLTNFRI